MYNREVFITALLLMIQLIQVRRAQQPCSPLDEGQYTNVSPTLLLNIYEADHQALSTHGNSEKYRSELRLNGMIGSSYPNGIVIEMMDDYQLINPADHFITESDSTSGKNYMRLIRPLDRDGPTEDYTDDVNLIEFTIKCTAANISIEQYYRTKIAIEDTNDNYPTFLHAPFSIQVNELTPVGTTITKVTAVDKDLNLNGGIKYQLAAAHSQVEDGSDFLSIDEITGDVTLSKELDYESLPVNTRFLNVIVRALDSGPEEYRSSVTTLRINVVDGDDNGPAFTYHGCERVEGICLTPQYTSSLGSTRKDQSLVVYLDSASDGDALGAAIDIVATDMDSSKNVIDYSIVATSPGGRENDYDIVTTHTNGAYLAKILPKKEVQTPVVLFIKATERSIRKRFAIAKLSITDDQENTAQGSTGNEVEKQTINEEFSREVVILIIFVVIFGTLTLCFIATTFYCSKRSRSHRKDLPYIKESSQVHDNESFSRL